MANKIYTSQEMREAADVVDDVSINDNGEYYYEKYDKFNPDIVRDMLRQAADAMESEKKREKKYEYSYRFLDGTVAAGHHENPRMVFGDPVHGRILVRREVGAWEEVKDGE